MASKPKRTKKPLAKKRNARKPALKPVPETLALFFDLVNLVPVQLRHPDWARKGKSSLYPKGVLYENAILNWRFGAESAEAVAARELQEPQVIEEWRFNTPALLWFKLGKLLEELPIALQAFVLVDQLPDQDIWSGVSPTDVPSELQALRNLRMIRAGTDELRTVVREASERINSRFQQGSVEAWPTAEELLSRARERLILVLAIQELFSWLAHREHSPLAHRELTPHLFLGEVFHRSGEMFLQAYLDVEGKLQFAPSRILQLIRGIEAKRIRECPFCFKLLWAGRTDTQYCSMRCSAAERMRRHRERWGITKNVRVK